MKISWRLGLASLVLAAGCEQSPPPPTETAPAASADVLPTVAPAAHWEKTRLVVVGHPTWSFELSYGADGDIAFGVFGEARWPKGTKVILGKAETELGTFTSVSLAKPYAVYGALPIVHPSASGDAGVDGSAPPSEVAFRPTATLSVRLPNGVEISLALPEGKVARSLEHTIMMEAATAPLRFDGEKASAGPHTLYFVQTLEDDVVVGPGKTLADVDWVASTTSEIALVEGRVCTFGETKVRLEVETETVTVVDRRTHAALDTKTFRPGSVACPAVQTGGRAISGAERDTVLAWLRSVAKAHGG